MKTIVVYQSKTGFTKRYAEWISKKLKCKALSEKEAVHTSFDDYDFVIYGSNVCAGKIGGLAKMKERVQAAGPDKLIVFVTGASPNGAQETINAMWKGNFSEQELEKIPHYYMQAGLNYEKMSIDKRLMMKMFAKMMSGKKSKSEEEAECAQAIQSSYDISSIDYIQPLVDYIRDKSKKEK